MTITLLIIAVLIGLALLIIGFMRSGTVALLSGAALFVLALLMASVAYAHDAPMGWKYEAYCCNGNSDTGDCQQISTDRVRITSNGYEVEIRPTISSACPWRKCAAARMSSITSACTPTNSPCAASTRRTWPTEINNMRERAKYQQRLAARTGEAA